MNARHDAFRKLSAFGKLTQYPSDAICLLAKEGPWIEAVAQETPPFLAFRFVKGTAYMRQLAVASCFVASVWPDRPRSFLPLSSMA